MPLLHALVQLINGHSGQLPRICFRICMLAMLLYTPFAFGQALPEQDCGGAIQICGSFRTDQIYTGPGQRSESGESCVRENNSVWFLLDVEQGGTLGFNIIPEVPADNYDFALFDLGVNTGRGCADLATLEPVRCNRTQILGSTGISAAFPGSSAPAVSDSSDSPTMFGLTVSGNQRFLLLVDHPDPVSGGFTLETQGTAQLSGPAARIVNVPDTVCGEGTFVIVNNLAFNQQLEAATVQPSDFEVIGPGGSGARITNVQIGGAFSRLLNFTIQTNGRFPGRYELRHIGDVQDRCGNTVGPETASFAVRYPPVGLLEAQPDVVCAGQVVEIQFNGEDFPQATYTWELDGGGPAPAPSAGPHYVSWPLGTGVRTVALTIDPPGCPPQTYEDVVTVNAATLAPTVSGERRCGPGGVTFSGNFPGVGTVRLYERPGGGAPIDLEAGNQTFTLETPVISQTRTYYIEFEDQLRGCRSRRVPVAAVVGTVPPLPQVDPVERCGTGSVVFRPQVAPGTGVRLYLRATDEVPLTEDAAEPLALESPVITASRTFYVRAFDPPSGCESDAVAVEAEVDPNAPASPVAQDVERCGPGAVTISASVTGIQGTVRLYTLAAGGEALAEDDEAPFVFENLPLDGTQPFYLEHSVVGISCPALERVRVDAQVHPVPPLPQAPNVTACNASRATFTVTMPGSYEVRLYAAATGGLPLVTGQTPLALLPTPAVGTTTTFYVEAENLPTGCTSPRSAVAVNIPVPPLPEGQAAPICGTGQAVIEITTAPEVESVWVFDANQNRMQEIRQRPFRFRPPTLSQTTTFFLASNIGPCESRLTPVPVPVVQPQQPRVNEAVRCGSGSLFLTDTHAPDALKAFTVYRRADADRPLFVDRTPVFQYRTPTLHTTTTYYVEVEDTNGCLSARVPVVARLLDAAAPPAPVVASSARCEAGSLTFTPASVPSRYRFRAYDHAEGGLPLGDTDTPPYALTIPGIGITKALWFAFYDPLTGCESPRQRAEAVVHPRPAPPVPTLPEAVCPGTEARLDLDSPLPVRLYPNDSTDTPIRTDGSAPYQLTAPPLTTTSTLYVGNIDPATGCSSPRVSVVVPVDVPAPLLPTQVTRCGVGPLTFSLGDLPSGTRVRLYPSETGGPPAATAEQAPWQLTLPEVRASRTWYAETVSPLAGCVSARVPMQAVLAKNSQGTLEVTVGDSTQTPCGIDLLLEATTNLAGAQIQWYPATGLTTDRGPRTRVLAPVRSISYTVLATRNGCMARAEVPVEVIPKALHITATTASPFCTTNGVTLQSEAGSALRWSPSAGLDTLLGTTVFATPTTQTTYTVTGTQNGCPAEGHITVEAQNPLTVRPVVWPVRQQNGQDGRLLVEAGGGVPPYAYALAGQGGWQTSNTFRALAPGSYTVRVRDGRGCITERRAEVGLLPEGCDRPTALRVASVRGTSVQLQWNGARFAAGYELSYRAAGEGDWSPALTTGDTVFTISGLLPGAAYAFRLRAVCFTTLTVSSYIQTEAETPSCAPITTLEYYNASDRALTLDWLSVPAHTSFEVWYQPDGAPDWQHIRQVPAPPYRLGGLEPGTAYRIQVRGYCGDADHFSDPREIPARTAPDSSCDPPANIRLERLTPNQVQLNWTESPQARDYLIRYRSAGSPWQLRNGPPPFALLTLSPDTPYEVEVKSLCTARISPWVPGPAFETPALRQAAALPDEGTEIQLEVYPNPAPGQFTVRWQPVSGPELRVQITDMQGRTVFAQTYPCGRTDCRAAVSVPRYTPGLHILKLKTGQQERTIKLMLTQ